MSTDRTSSYFISSSFSFLLFSMFVGLLACFFIFLTPLFVNHLPCRSALQSLHKACEVARCHNYYPGSLFLTWVSYYQTHISSEQQCINEWNAMQDVQSHRSDSPVLFTDLWVRTRLQIHSHTHTSTGVIAASFTFWFLPFEYFHVLFFWQIL